MLFPSITGRPPRTNGPEQPVAEVSDALGLGYHFTQKGMRRTFNDLCRAAKVESLVTRSISAHLTERMQHHYSTVRPEEQQESIARVTALFRAANDQEASSSASSNGAEHGTTSVVTAAAAAGGGSAPSGALSKKSG